MRQGGEYQIGGAVASNPDTGPGANLTDIEWRVETRQIPYPEAIGAMEARVARIAAGTDPELIWLLEHPPLYTAGTSALESDLIDAGRLPVHRTGRGGQYTYHGPGQRIAYVILDLRQRGMDVRRHVHGLEAWMIATLARFGVRGERRKGRVGIWVAREGGREDKIGAIGVRVRRWVAYHGLALNVDCDLAHYAGIVPCGLRGYGVTSLRDLGVTASMDEVDAALRATFAEAFAPAASAA